MYLVMSSCHCGVIEMSACHCCHADALGEKEASAEREAGRQGGRQRESKERRREQGERRRGNRKKRVNLSFVEPIIIGIMNSKSAQQEVRTRKDRCNIATSPPLIS